jgi:hypothetical protein
MSRPKRQWSYCVIAGGGYWWCGKNLVNWDGRDPGKPLSSHRSFRSFRKGVNALHKCPDGSVLCRMLRYKGLNYVAGEWTKEG